MALITKFLKLLKPQSNEYINVTTQISDNYDKIDEGVEKISNEKLDKGNVQSKYDTAEKIGNEIDKKFDKTGGTISGAVTVTGNEIVNGSISCKTLILDGYTITIE